MEACPTAILLLPGRVGARSLPPTRARSLTVTTACQGLVGAGGVGAPRGPLQLTRRGVAQAADAGAACGLVPRSTAGGRAKTAEQRELEALRRRNEVLESELNKTRLALEITGKAHALLELLSESADTDPRSTR